MMTHWIPRMAQQMKDKHKVTEDVVQEDSRQPQMYAKDSLDRFGDDMCEHILSYLTLEDRFRCECVSKQWQRFIYTTVRHITITKKMMTKVMPYLVVLKKCPHPSIVF
ncbi:unnamed protein product [Oppiella nova]|uniref:F-box domain-containing protein n=1 Tax=Oppiella nova TaxID=334625 RepID=A0A7R9QIB6_9ACAR|nr:unnamed protein product [Oppiella nova]CAG2165920.1 unnamed protein product [Oppiella nova]